MTSSFLAFFTKVGIVCASDTDHTIFRLSRNEPLAVAVTPESPIPWQEIIDGYLRKRKPQMQEVFSDYTRDFFLYVSSLPVDKKWGKRLSTRLAFVGYGTEDIFPSVTEAHVTLDEDGKWGVPDVNTRTVTLDDSAFYCTLGDFESVATLLSGATRDSKAFLIQRIADILGVYKERIRNRFQGTDLERVVNDRLATIDPNVEAAKMIAQTDGSVFQELAVGLDSFGIEDLVDATEKLVNANAKLRHLRTGAKGEQGQTREIAVLTRAEGLTWIKHSLFAL